MPHPITETRRYRDLGRNVAASIAIISLIACTPPAATQNSYVTPWKLTGREMIAVSATPASGGASPGKPIAGAGNAALSGAGSAAGGVASADWGSCSGDMCGAAALVGLAVIVGAAIVGGVVGAARSHTKAETDAASKILQKAVASAKPWQDVEGYVVASGYVWPDGPEVYRSRHGLPRLALQTQLAFRQTGSAPDPDIVTILRVTGTLQISSRSAPVTVAWQHASAPYNYFRLAEDDGDLMRRVIRNEAAEMAKLIRAELALAVASGHAPR